MLRPSNQRPSWSTVFFDKLLVAHLFKNHNFIGNLEVDYSVLLRAVYRHSDEPSSQLHSQLSNICFKCIQSTFMTPKFSIPLMVAE
jgi:hypothetical protein